MTLFLKSVNEECEKVGVLVILQISVFKPLAPLRSELRQGQK